VHDRYRVHRAATAAAILLVLSGLSSGDWPGFHGAERQGLCGSDVGPLHWSPSQNVVWQTAIPGRGHSSPIVSQDAVYVTTSYECGHADVGTNAWRYAVLASALTLAATGVRASATALREGQTTLRIAGRCVGLFLFVQMLVAATIVALFGRHLLNPNDAAVRHWLVSILLFFLCMAAASLVVPWRSRQHLAAGALCLLYAVLSWIIFARQGFTLDLGSTKGLVMLALAASPLVLGGVLCAAHLLSRRRRSRDDVRSLGDEPRRPAMRYCAAAVLAGFIAAATPFFLLLCRAGEYQIPDPYLLNTRVKPEGGWGAVAVFVAAAGIATVASIRKAGRTGPAASAFWRRASLAAAVCLAGVYFAGIVHAGKPQEFVRALVRLDAGTGRISWICEGLTAQSRTESKMVTHASPTPVVEGGRVYAYFGEDGLMCVDPNGQLLWKRPEPMFRCHFGAGTSPVARNGSVVVVSDVMACDDLSSSITAFDGSSGRPLWRKTRESHAQYATYNTPLMMSLDGRDIVVVHGWKGVTGYDLKTGDELWSYDMDHAGKHLVAGMVCDEGRLYVIGAKRVVALALSRLGAGGDPLAWSRPIPDEKSSTPVLANGLLFLVTESGMAYCLESDSGQILWKQRLKGRYFSSVVSTAGRVLFTNDAGQTTVVAAGREYKELANNRLGEPVYASPAPTGDRLLVRTDSCVCCIGEPKP
jgi:outer membrane protein assembly factor BamB